MPENPLQELRYATEKHLAQHRPTLDWIYAKRFWLAVIILSTLFLPTLANRYNNTACFNRSLEIEQTGFDIFNPCISLERRGVVVRRSWCINPFAAAVYLSAAFLAYRVFTGKSLSPKLVFALTIVICVCALTLPLTHLPVCDVLLAGFWCKWDIQPVCWGWFVLSAASVALLLSTWAQRIPAVETK